MVLWSAKVPKALRQSSNEPFAPSLAHQKTVALRFVFNNFFKLNHLLNTKPLRFRFVSANLPELQLFFDFPGSWD